MISPSHETAWPVILEAVKKVRDRRSVHVKVWYSFKYGESIPWVIRHGFKKAAAELAGMVTQLFDRTYSPARFKLSLTTRVKKGLEKEPSEPLGTEYSLEPGSVAALAGIGDIRVSYRALDGGGRTLAEAYFPEGDLNVLGNQGGDMVFDKAENWGFDHKLKSNETSAMYVALHELMHAFGMPHENIAQYRAVLAPFYNYGTSLKKLFTGRLLHQSQEALTMHGFLMGPDEALVLSNSGQVYHLDTRLYKSMQPMDGKQSCRSVSLSPSSAVYAVSDRGYLMRLVSDRWYTLGKKRNDWVKVVAGARLVVLDKKGRLWTRLNQTSKQPFGTRTARFRRRTPPIRDMDVSSGATPLKQNQIAIWVVSKRARSYMGLMSWNSAGPIRWFGTGKLPGKYNMVQVSVGWLGRLVFALDSKGRVWRRTHVTFTYRKGRRWVPVSSSPLMRHIHVSSKGDLFAVGKDSTLYIRDKITARSPGGKLWLVTDTTAVSKFCCS